MTAALPTDIATATDGEQARAFLECLYGAATGGFIELRAFVAGRAGKPVQEWFWHEDAAPLLARIDEIEHTHDVYVGVGLRRESKGGSKAHVAALGVLWADLDCAEGEHKGGGAKHETKAEALAALHAMPHPPTLVVDSGGGLHAYWRLADPLVLSDLPVQQRAEQTMRRIAAACGGDPAVCDVARILRVPGTHNRKEPDPRPVRVVWYDANDEHDLSDLEESLPEATSRTAPTLRPVEALEPDERARRARGRLHERMFLPCMRALASGAGWQEGEGHTIRLRAAAHLRSYGIPEGAAPAMIADLDSTIGSDAAAERDLLATVSSVYHGRDGEGYAGLGCEDPLWTGRRCSDRERASCPIWTETHEADAQRAALDALAAAHGGVSAEATGAELTMALRSVYDALATLSPWPSSMEAAIGETVALYKKRASGLTKTGVSKEVSQRVQRSRKDGDEALQVGPGGLIVPVGWRLRGRQLLRLTYGDDGNVIGSEVVADRPPLLVARYRDVDSDERQLECEFCDPDGANGGRLTRIPAPKQSWATPQGLGRLADLGLPVHAGNARALTAWVDACETANAERLPYQESTHRLGWHGDAFVLGDETIAPDGGSAVRFVPLGAGEMKTAEALKPSGSEADWMAMVLPRAIEYPRLLLCVVGAFAPVIMGAVDAPTFIIELVGDSSTGKTTASRIAISAWGSPAHPGISRTFWATDNSHERYLATIGQGLPGLLDDSQNNPRQEQASASAYWIANGQGKGRAAPNGTRVVASWRTIVFVTGEKRLDLWATTTGATARVMSFDGSPFGGHVPQVVADLTDCITTNHGHAGRRFVRWLLAHGNWRALVCNRYGHVVRRVRKRWPGDKIMSRRLAYAATLITTAELLDQAFPWPIKDSTTLTEHVEEALDQWAKEQPDRDQSRESYEAFLSWAQSNRTRFVSPGDAVHGPSDRDRGPCFGIWDVEKKVVKVLATCALDWATEAKYDLTTSAKQWRAREWLLVPEKEAREHLTTRVRFQGSLARCYIVRLLEDGGSDVG